MRDCRWLCVGLAVTALAAYQALAPEHESRSVIMHAGVGKGVLTSHGLQQGHAACAAGRPAGSQSQIVAGAWSGAAC